MNPIELRPYHDIGKIYKNTAYCIIASLLSVPLVFPISISIQSIFDGAHIPVYSFPFAVAALAFGNFFVFVVWGIKLVLAMRVAGWRFESKQLVRTYRYLISCIVTAISIIPFLLVPDLFMSWIQDEFLSSLDLHVQNAVPVLLIFVPPVVCGVIGFPIALYELRHFATVFPEKSTDPAMPEGREGLKRSGIALKLGLLGTIIFSYVPFHFIGSSFYAIIEPNQLFDAISTPFLVVAIISTSVLGLLAVIATIQGMFRIAVGFEHLSAESLPGEIIFENE